MRNKLLIFAIVVIVLLIIYFTYQYFKTQSYIKAQESPKTVTVKQGDSVVTYQTKDLNINASLEFGNVFKSETKVLQSILGFTGADVDGVFGPNTLAALQRRFGVDKITLSTLFSKVGGVNEKGREIVSVVGKHGWTTTPQTIYTLRPKGNSALQKYGDFTIGEEYRAGSNFDAGEIIDIVGDDVILMKNGSPGYGAQRVNVNTQFFYAKKGQLSIV